MDGAPTRLDPGENLTPAQRQAQQATPSGLGRFVVASVGLDVPLGAMNMVDGQIVPPSFTSAYRIANLGVPLNDAAAGTVFVAAHSTRWGAKAPGDYLFDVATGAATVKPGATINVGAVAYTVDGSLTVPKTELPYQASVWADVPGRLVIFTCLELPDNSPAVDNLILTAHLAGQA
jgi:hypothetical protein